MPRCRLGICLLVFVLVLQVRAELVTHHAELLQQGYQYCSPLPESEYNAEESRILVRFHEADPNQMTNVETAIRVTGAESGVHLGQSYVASDQQTVVFIPHHYYALAESVTVVIAPKFSAESGIVLDPIQYTFYVNVPGPNEPEVIVTELAPTQTALVLNAMAVEEAVSVEAAAEDVLMRVEGQVGIYANGVSVPSDFPYALITVNQNPSPGYLFLDNQGLGDTRYAMLLDNTGAPVWYRRGNAFDFKVHPNGTMSWSSNMNGEPNFIGVDAQFNPIRHYACTDGYITDSHELQILDDGGYLLIGERGLNVDMRRYVPDGLEEAMVIENCIQEFSAEGELIFQWRGWDHLPITDTDPCMCNLTKRRLDYIHTNAIDVDTDGHLLLSHRHMGEVTKIDRQTGEILWRLGGARSDFKFVNDPLNGFSAQHDARGHEHNRYTMFDNGNSRTPRQSRAVEYELNTNPDPNDPNSMTATLVWEFRDDKFTHYMGNAQRLENGNTLINWVLGGYPKVTEVDPNGEKQLELNMLPYSILYRSFKGLWDGQVDRPYLLLETELDHLVLLFNKFGDPNVSHYRIYGGPSPEPTTVIAESESTLVRLYDLQNKQRHYFRVTAVDQEGGESDYSNQEDVMVSFSGPNVQGENMVTNSSFSDGQEGWILSLQGSANAELETEDEVGYIRITQGGAYADIQLRQEGMVLVKGEPYVLEYDAMSTRRGIMTVKVTNAAGSRDYSEIGFVSPLQVFSHHKHTFWMSNTSDDKAEIRFELGGMAPNVFLDNIVLYRGPR